VVGENDIWIESQPLNVPLPDIAEHVIAGRKGYKKKAHRRTQYEAKQEAMEQRKSPGKPTDHAYQATEGQRENQTSGGLFFLGPTS